MFSNRKYRNYSKIDKSQSKRIFKPQAKSSSFCFFWGNNYFSSFHPVYRGIWETRNSAGDYYRLLSFSAHFWLANFHNWWNLDLNFGLNNCIKIINHFKQKFTWIVKSPCEFDARHMKFPDFRNEILSMSKAPELWSMENWGSTFTGYNIIITQSYWGAGSLWVPMRVFPYTKR